MNLFEPVLLSMGFIWNPTQTDVGIEGSVFFADAAGSGTMALIQELPAADKPVITIDHHADSPILGFAARM